LQKVCRCPGADERVGTGAARHVFIVDQERDLSAEHVEAFLRVVVDVDRRAAGARRRVPLQHRAGAVAIGVQTGEPKAQEVETLRLGGWASHRVKLPLARSRCYSREPEPVALSSRRA